MPIRVLVGATLVLVVAWSVGSFGFAFALGIPWAIGFALGYGSNLRSKAVLATGIVFLPMLVFGILTARLAGALCALIVGAIFLGPCFSVWSWRLCFASEPSAD